MGKGSWPRGLRGCARTCLRPPDKDKSIKVGSAYLKHGICYHTQPPAELSPWSRMVRKKKSSPPKVLRALGNPPLPSAGCHWNCFLAAQIRVVFWNSLRMGSAVCHGLPPRPAF